MSTMETEPVALRRVVQTFEPPPIASADSSPSIDGIAGNVQVPSWKRRLDLFCIMLAAPAWVGAGVGCALWIKMTSRGPLFFKQERVGLAGKKFEILKFRSMKHGADTKVHEDHVQRVFEEGPMIKMDATDERLVAGGRFLRSSGLDELPQLINVIRGQMSLVGPRPCTPNELDKYSGGMKQRFNTLPGLTGNWQVNGKNNTTFRQMVQLDVDYVEKKSIVFDLKIMFRTIPALLTQMSETRALRRSQAATKK